MIALEFDALEKLKEKLLTSCYEAGIGYRMVVTKKRSGEVACVLRLDTEQKGDRVIEFQGMRIFVDPASAKYVEENEFESLDISNGHFILKDNS